jgi:hypothetical protein
LGSDVRGVVGSLGVNLGGAVGDGGGVLHG